MNIPLHWLTVAVAERKTFPNSRIQEIYCFLFSATRKMLLCVALAVLASTQFGDSEMPPRELGAKIGSNIMERTLKGYQKDASIQDVQHLVETIQIVANRDKLNKGCVLFDGKKCTLELRSPKKQVPTERTKRPPRHVTTVTDGNEAKKFLRDHVYHQRGTQTPVTHFLVSLLIGHLVNILGEHQKPRRIKDGWWKDC